MGLLRVRGTIDVSQFWPSGKSDADTTKVVIDVADGGILFGDSPAKLKPTSVFDGAQMIIAGQGKKPVIQTAANGARKITIRLQGIDAPELHYKAQGMPKGAGEPISKAFGVEYRQPLGEQAAFETGKFMSTLAANGAVPCEVDTTIDLPNDAFDVYARLVGEIFVTVGGKRTNLNEWIVRQGWAVPGLYTSMSKAEIEAMLSAWQEATGANRGIVPQLSKKADPADVKLTYRSGAAVPGGKPGPDPGPVILPKAFRRLVTYTVKKKLGLLDAGITTFTGYLSKSKDPYIPTHIATAMPDEVRRKLAPASPLCVPFHSKVTATGEVEIGGKDIVFLESATELLDASGKPVTSWSGGGGKAAGGKKPAAEKKPAKKAPAKKAPAKKAPAKKSKKK